MIGVDGDEKSCEVTWFDVMTGRMNCVEYVCLGLEEKWNGKMLFMKVNVS